MGGVYQSLMRMAGVWSGGVEGGAWWWWWVLRWTGEEECVASCVAVVGKIGSLAWSYGVWRVVVWYVCRFHVVIHQVIEAPC